MVGSTKQRLDKITSELDSENLSTLLAFADKSKLGLVVSEQLDIFHAAG